MTAPSPYSAVKPKLQLAWDSTSLRALQFCARYYQLSQLEGWRGSSIDLEFGILFASSAETFKKVRAAGGSHEDASLAALRYAVENSWEHSECANCGTGTCEGVCGGDGREYLGQPWGGHYEDQWHCTGTEPFKNAKGNRAKCPWSHKGKWFPPPSGDTCGVCGSPTETVRRYAPNDRLKNRETLVRLVIGYCDEQPQEIENGRRAIIFPDGRAAVELSWKMPLPVVAKTGERFIASGHFDSLETDGVENFVVDNKTTKSYISGKDYWKQYAPNAQIDMHDVAGALLYPQLNIKGVMIDAAQVTASGAEYASQIFYRNEAQRDEFLNEVKWWLEQAERYADDNYWPMNRTNCKFCDFNSICSKDPSQRERYLKADFTQRHWNPLEER